MQAQKNKTSSCTVRTGQIKSINKEFISISILSTSACAACHAKGMCSSADQKEKYVTVPNKGQVFEIGEQVNIIMEESLGMKAVLLAYILPVFVLLFFIISLVQLGVSQILAGILSLLTTAVYFFIMYFFKDKLKNEFTFLIEKI